MEVNEILKVIKAEQKKLLKADEVRPDPKTDPDPVSTGDPRGEGTGDIT